MLNGVRFGSLTAANFVDDMTRSSSNSSSRASRSLLRQRPLVRINTDVMFDQVPRTLGENGILELGAESNETSIGGEIWYATEGYAPDTNGLAEDPLPMRWASIISRTHSFFLNFAETLRELVNYQTHMIELASRRYFLQEAFLRRYWEFPPGL